MQYTINLYDDHGLKNSYNAQEINLDANLIGPGYEKPDIGVLFTEIRPSDNENVN